MTKRQAVDWEAIEREYRAGQLSVHEIARQQGVSHVAILKQAKKLGWSRDLSKRVRQSVTARLVTNEVTTPAQETVAIETAAARGVEVVRQHRADISQARETFRDLLAELREACQRRDEIEDEVATETASERNPQRRAMMLRAVSLPSRTGVLKDLSIAGRTLIELERQAFSLDEPDDVSDEIKIVYFRQDDAAI